MQSPNTVRGWATEQDWNLHKERIESLYVVENKSLNEVMAVMETEHGLKATVKMYKNRITKWGIYKRKKSKGSNHSIRERRASTVDSNVSECRTEDVSKTRNTALSHIPAHPTTPQSFRLPQLIFTSVYNYYIGSLEAGTWYDAGKTWDLVSTKARGNPAGQVGHFLDRHYMACSLLDQGLFQDAGKALNEASALIKDVLASEIPGVLPALFILMSYPRMANRPELIHLLLKQFAALARILFPENHPMAQMLKNLINFVSLDMKQLDRVLLVSFQSGIDALTAKLGPMHSHVLRLQCKIIEIFETRYDIDKAEGMLKSILDQSKTSCGPDDARTHNTLGTLSEVLLKRGKCDEAAYIASNILAQSPGTVSSGQSMSRKVSALFLMARVHYEQQRPAIAVETLQQAIDLNESIFGLNHILTNRFLLTMKEWLSAHGRYDQAGEISSFLSKCYRTPCENHHDGPCRSHGNASECVVRPRLWSSSTYPRRRQFPLANLEDCSQPTSIPTDSSTAPDTECVEPNMFSMDLVSNIRRSYERSSMDLVSNIRRSYERSSMDLVSNIRRSYESFN